MAVKPDLAPDDLNGYLVKNSITNSPHEKLLYEAKVAAAGFQYDMFALLERKQMALF